MLLVLYYLGRVPDAVRCYCVLIKLRTDVVLHTVVFVLIDLKTGSNGL